MDELEIVNDRKEILALAGLGLYQSELAEKLDMYIQIDPKFRKHWTNRDLDIYLRKRVSTKIVDNEFGVDKTNPKKTKKVKTDKEMISLLSEELGLELMAIKHIFGEVKEQLQLGSTKADTKNFLIAQIYDQINQLDMEIEGSESERDKQKWYELKMKAMDQLAKIENLEEKAVQNNTVVHGNVNTKNSTVVDKQLVVSEQQAMLKLLGMMGISNGS